MKPWVAGCLAGMLAGGIASLLVLKTITHPGSWFSIAGDMRAQPAPQAQLTRPASEGVVCLYASVAYKPGDVIAVKDASTRIVCTAGPADAAGVTHGLWLQVEAETAPAK